jgi:ethanolamine utilization protein EutA (predicted chaperonin)
MKDFNKVYEALIEYGYFTEKELELITNINGNTIETLNDCIYSRFGFHDLGQLLGEEEDEED